LRRIKSDPNVREAMSEKRMAVRHQTKRSPQESKAGARQPFRQELRRKTVAAETME